VLAATGLLAALTLTATACEPGGDGASSGPGAGSSRSDGRTGGGLADDLADRLRQLGIDVDDWKDGGWRDWDKDQWLDEADDFVNPVIEDLWQPERMRSAQGAGRTVPPRDASADRGISDPPPAPVGATPERTPYHANAAFVGKVFFDSPEGALVCSGTVVKDVYHPGQSNLVWTAGHCVHAGRSGGWYRNIAFVPAYNDLGMSAAQLAGATPREIAPYGLWWADRAATSDEWIAGGSQTGGAGAPYDYAVLQVRPESGGRSLEETVGAALDVDFSAPAVSEAGSMGAWGYPASPPYDGLRMFRCVDRPGRFSLGPDLPTMYRIGCTMTGGASGGGWFRVVGGATRLVSNTSIGSADGTWLAGPRLGREAKQLYAMMGAQYGGR
ncbi:trypsin-like serine peptidase, partial [Streptomyces poonensis]